jgi:hypothetical protein
MASGVAAQGGTMQVRSSRATRLATPVGLMVAFAAVAGLAACSSSPVEPFETKSTFSCVDDSKQCIAERQATLQSLLADKSRSWVKSPATPHAYASGVRMFAFKQKKTELSCDELGTGRREADAAPGALRSAAGQALSPAQISRGTMFAAEVGRELTTEMKRRCKV